MGRRLTAERPVPRTLLALVALALAGALLVVWSDPARANVFTVKNTKDKGKGSLRNAINKANNNPGPDEIRFNIRGGGVKTITPASELPTITDPVTIDGYSQPGASQNTLDEGNDAVIKIQLNGIDAGPVNGLVIEAADTTIKGLVINRFEGAGVVIFGAGATDNKVLGNFIGTNADGTEALGNGDGVNILFAPENTVGGTRAAARNVISGNQGDDIFSAGIGVFLRSGDRNKVEGNYIGTDKNGTEALGNSGVGVGILAADDNTVGGTAGGARNVISGNGAGGVIISGNPATGNKVEGNFVGTGANGTGDLGNSDDGVSIFVAGNTVGGTASGAGNRIAHNEGDGVLVSGGAAVGNRVLSNQIFSNDELGIDLGPEGVTDNDPDDTDTDANNLQNFPEDLSAIRSNTTGLTTITGTLNSNPGEDFIIQCFVAAPGPFAAAPDPSGHGEGQFFLVQDTTVTTDAEGDASFSCVTNFPVVPGQTKVTATATNTATGDTSEFSENEVVVAGP